MYRCSLPFVAVAVLLCTGRPAQAFHHHAAYYYYPHYYPYGVPMSAAPASPPFSFIQGLQLAQLALNVLGQAGFGGGTVLHFLGDLGQRGGLGGPGAGAPPPVPADVVATINALDTRLSSLVDKTNALSDLNPKYKDKITVSAAKSTTGPGTAGPPK